MKYKLKKERIPNILAILAVIYLMISAYFTNKDKAKIIEASKLPFHNTELSQVEDGTYYGKTYTSFAHVQVEVTVENHQLKNIIATECEGLEAVKAKDVLQEMIKQNTVVVQAPKKAEIGTMVFISCVDGALWKEE